MNISTNVYKLYVIKIAKWFMLIMPIIALFYHKNGMNDQDILTLRAIYSIAIVLLEIPSGYFADVWGRKSTLIIGSILGVLGFAVYSFTYGFWGFLIAEIILGIGQSFISGSDSAMLYDTLLETKREKEYTKMEGRVISMGNFAETIALLIGGALAEISLRTPFYFQTGIAFLAVPAAIMLVEPARKKITNKYTLKSILNVFTYSLNKNKRLKWTILYSSIIGTSTLTLAWFIQQYFYNLLEFSKSQIGSTLACLNLIVAVTSLFSYKIEEKLGQIKTILFIGFFIVTGYLVIGLFPHLWILGVFVIFYFTRGIATPVLRDYINRLTGSEIRATVLSIRSFIIRIFFAGIGPFLGWYSDSFSVNMAIFVGGLFFLISCGITIPFMIKHNHKNK